jgi:hypothetical protein
VIKDLTTAVTLGQIAKCMFDKYETSYKKFTSNVYPRFYSTSRKEFILSTARVLKGKMMWADYGIYDRYSETKQFIHENVRSLDPYSKVWWVTLGGSGGDLLIKRKAWGHIAACFENQGICVNAAFFHPKKRFEFILDDIREMFLDKKILEYSEKVEWSIADSIIPYESIKKGLFLDYDLERVNPIIELCAKLDTAYRLADLRALMMVLSTYNPPNKCTIDTCFYGEKFDSKTGKQWPSLRAYLFEDTNSAIFFKGICHKNAFGTTMTKIRDQSMFRIIKNELSDLSPKVKHIDEPEKIDIISEALYEIGLDNEVMKLIREHFEHVDELLSRNKNHGSDRFRDNFAKVRSNLKGRLEYKLKSSKELKELPR